MSFKQLHIKPIKFLLPGIFLFALGLGNFLFGSYKAGEYEQVIDELSHFEPTTKTAHVSPLNRVQLSRPSATRLNLRQAKAQQRLDLYRIVILGGQIFMALSFLLLVPGILLALLRKKKQAEPVALLLLLLAASSCQGPAHAPRSGIIGRVEYVMLEDVDFRLKARIDTGAGVSSLQAKILEIKKPEAPNGSERVVFKISDGEGRTRQLERRIVEWATIKSKSGKTDIRRPVVVMDFCLDGKQIEARVNLADRSKFLYPVLIGRNVLRTGDFLIDPRKKFISQPVCPTRPSS